MPNNSFLRFCLVGITNTLVDVPIFLALHAAGLSILLANICSTSVALLVSLLLNARFTFRGRDLTPARVVLYIVVTLVGLWALQPAVINLVLSVNGSLHITSPVIHLAGHASLINTSFAKLSSIVVTLVWNYTWYSQVVFRGTGQPQKGMPGPVNYRTRSS